MVDDDDIDGLAAEYVLGSLDAGERKQIAARRRTDAALDMAINAWEARLEPLSHLLPGIAPPSRLFSDIEKRLFDPQELQTARVLECGLDAGQRSPLAPLLLQRVSWWPWFGSHQIHPPVRRGSMQNCKEA